jgi:predicted transcriptional regulator of viral defense system
LARASEQLALTAPERAWNVRGLTQQQHGVLEWARAHGEVRTRELRLLGYAAPYSAPSVALGRLEARGLLRRARRGRYVPVPAPTERAVA